MKTKTINNFTVPENFEESIENFHKPKESSRKLSERKNKPLITQSKLFLEVASVIGKVEALEELTKAYRGYDGNPSLGNVFQWNKDLLNAFSWADTVQGHSFWNEIHTKVMSDD